MISLRLLSESPRNLYRWVLPALVAVVVAACGSATLNFAAGELPPLLPVARISSASCFDWSPDGESVAFEEHGLKILHLPSGHLRASEVAGVRRIAWGSPGLALATVDDERYHVYLKDGDGDGRAHEIASGAGVVVDLKWSGESLFVLVMRHTYLSFGVNQRTVLLTWRHGEPLSEELLADATLKPSTPRMVGESFPYGPYLLVSPFGDEIVYSRLHDPPAFPVNYRLVVRHLASGNERLLGRHALSGGDATMLPDGEQLLLSDGKYHTKRMALWDTEQSNYFDHPAAPLEASGTLIYASGSLYRGDIRLWTAPQAAAARFSPDGTQLAMVASGRLYIVAVENQKLPLDRSPARLKLRRLRALGLITPDDYRRYLKE